MALLPFWTKELTPEIVKKAESELGETPEVRKKSLEALRKLIESEEEFQIPTEDSFLLRFLRSKKYDVKRSFKCLKIYYGLKSMYPEILNKVPSDIKGLLEKNIVYLTMKRGYNAEGVLIFLIGDVDENVLNVEDIFRTGFLSADIGIDAEVSQVCGSSIIFDFKDVSLKKLAYLSTPTTISLLPRGLQDAWPHRINGVHIVNEPPFFTFTFNMIKPMLSRKMKNRIHFHGNNLKNLYKYFPVEILPQQLGGLAGPKEFQEYQTSILDRQKLGEKLSEFVYKGVKYP
ncbi:clavesin-1 [Trichonephila clavata]|uniref:Clavesin-1 n=1 Tax=Trichonephila clavata TaxID=2740835 RepID=A0A8X6F5P9_TRICU|nr:clavesin-1 [Trichonephila clavata]